MNKHYILDLRGCTYGMTDANTAQSIFVDSCKRHGATVLHYAFHRFPNDAYTGVVLLSESHASVHTWPEKGYAAIDIFTCGDVNIAEIVEDIIDYYDPKEVNRIFLMRE